MSASGRPADRDPVLSGRDLVCGYGQSIVLEGVDLEIGRGEIVALLGGSGSGKSTLLRALIGLTPPISGEVRLFGEALYAIDDEARNALLRRVGVLFQQDALFGSLSVLDNVALPLVELTRLPRPVIYEMARMKLELVGLGGLEGRLPSGISGGQRKRAALARASVLDPEIILCDEPSAGLDPIVAAEIDEVLLRFRDIFGVTIVAVTHELASIQTIADRAIMLGRGGVLAAGAIDELAQSEEPDVRDFFHRRPRPRAGAAGQLLAQIRGEA